MRYLLPLALMVFLAMPCYAAFKGGEQTRPGGFSGPISGAMAETVADAKKLPNKSRVVLVGNIVSQLAGSKDEFIFRDPTGEMPVDISRRVFNGQDITPQDKVRIGGKMSVETGRESKLDVNILELVK